MLRLSSLFLLLQAALSQGILHATTDTLPSGEYYDFIVVGGSPYDWNYTTTPQTNLDGRVLGYPQGHVLGGSSSINGMYYTRGSSSDFDRYAQLSGDAGWSWKNLQPYFKKNEVWTPPADNHNTSGQFNPAVHGFKGINSVSLSGFSQGIDSRVIQTTQELPDEFPYNEDMNSGNPIGVGWLQSTIGKGQRSSSATSYLAPNILRQNLDVVLGTQVTRILQTTVSGKQPALRTIEVATNPKSARKRLVAAKEIILSAGVIGTPHILLNSGIGDESELRAHGVKPILHLPDVGKNFSDQPAVVNSWRVASNDTLDEFVILDIICFSKPDHLFSLSRDPELRAQYLRQWEKNKTGPLVVPTAGTHIIWGRLANSSSIFNSTMDPSSGINSPHYEMFTICISTFRSIAGGSITLKSSDPFEYPLIDPGTLASEFDRLALRETVKTSLRFVAANAWKGYVIEPVGSLQNVTSDEDLDKSILESATLALHGVGTAAMSALHATHGVVDPDLHLKSASGLRIVDASVLPYVPAAHTQAPVYIIAERAADLIKDSWRKG
ncbi:hypothetical protein DXG01_011390 [Tephrocybe rancida]|nr:hypothetical protein DXG01_011390 [Tephrocybe rancida]